MTRRNALSQCLTVALIMSLGVAAQAATASFEVHKLNLGPTRYFNIHDSSGASTLGVSTGTFLPGYTFYDEGETVFLEAKLQPTVAPQSFLGQVLSAPLDYMFDPVTQFFGGFHTLQIFDKTGAQVGSVRRHPMTLHTGKFTLSNAQGEAVAHALANTTGDAVRVADAHNPVHVLADMRRVTTDRHDGVQQQDFWSVSVNDVDAVTYDTLRTLATYISDYQDWLRWGSSFEQFNLGSKDVTNTVRNRGVERATDQVINSGAALLGR